MELLEFVWLPAASCRGESNLSDALCSGESNLANAFAVGSQISPLHDAARNQVNDCCRNLPAAWCSGESNFPTAFCSREMWLPTASCSGESNLAAAFFSGDSNLTTAWCSRESNHSAAWGSGESIWQQGVKPKNFGRPPKPLKGESCKNHIWGTFTILVLWESCITVGAQSLCRYRRKLRKFKVLYLGLKKS